MSKVSRLKSCSFATMLLPSNVLITKTTHGAGDRRNLIILRPRQLSVKEMTRNTYLAITLEKLGYYYEAVIAVIFGYL